MTTITTQDGTSIFYKDWGPKDAQPVVSPSALKAIELLANRKLQTNPGLFATHPDVVNRDLLAFART